MKRAFLIDFENVKSAGLAGLEHLTTADEVIILYSANSNTISFEMHQKIMESPACVDYYQIRRGGKNSLDFQLSSLLGYLLGTGEYSHLYIVSNDGGFDVLRDFWTSGFVETQCIVYRRGTLENCLAHSRLLESEQVPQLEPVSTPEIVVVHPTPVIEQVSQPVTLEQNEDEQQEKEAIVEKQGKTAKVEAQPKPKKQKQPQTKTSEQPPKKPAQDKQERKDILEILAKSQGKQEFYRKLIAKYGQKKGLELYRTVKSEYTNLKKEMENR